MKFLTLIYESSNTYGTINNYRSAISLICPNEIGQDPNLKRFCKGASNLKPQAPKYAVTWDPHTVLDFIKNLPSENKISLDELNKKLATLLVLATGQRVQTISKIRLQNIKIKDDHAIIFIPDKIKTSKVNSIQPTLEFNRFSNEPKICVLNTLELYLKKTEKLRCANEDFLFISSKKPYKSVSKDSISRWIKDILGKSVIDTQIFNIYMHSFSII